MLVKTYCLYTYNINSFFILLYDKVSSSLSLVFRVNYFFVKSIHIKQNIDRLCTYYIKNLYL